MNVDSNRPQRYFYFYFILFRFLGLGWWHHPDQNNTANFFGWYKTYSKITVFFCIILTILCEITDFLINDNDKRSMFMLSVIITHSLTFIKLYFIFFRNKEFQSIIRTLEVDLYKYYQNDLKIMQTIRLSNVMNILFFFFGYATIGNSMINGLISDAQRKSDLNFASLNGTWSYRYLPQSFYVPWSYEGDTSYIATTALEIVAIVWLSSTVMIIDTFVACITLHMSSQFEILQEGIAEFYERTLENVKVQENNMGQRTFYYDTLMADMLERNLILLIQQHQMLLSCVTLFCRTYTIGFATQLLSSSFVICVIMVQVSADASSFSSLGLATSMAFLFAMLTQLALQCFTGNELMLQANLVADAVWRCDWVHLSPKLRRYLIFITQRAQKPLFLSAANIKIIDNRCFISIVKLAYSYYAVLSQKTKEVK